MFNPIRALARPALASMFVAGGIDALRDPGPKAPAAEDVTDPIRDQVSALDSMTTPELVRLNGAVQLLGGLALAFGKVPRLASAALAASLVPTTLAGHRFWEEGDPRARTNQQIHFFKNLSMLGGLVLAAMDTEGRPGLAWRARHAAEHAGLSVDHAKREAALASDVAAERLKRASADARAAGRRAKQRVELEAKHAVDRAGTRAELAKEKLTPDVGDARRLVKALRD